MIVDEDLIKFKAIRSLHCGKRIPAHMMTEAHHELVNGGFADFSGEVMSKNWKTDYWRPTPAVPYAYEAPVLPDPINNRFEILDL